LNAGGVFTTVTPKLAGNCKPVGGVIGAEDMQIDRQARLLFISATDRRALAMGKPNPQDGIYALKLDDPNAKPVKLAGTPKDFHPHGLSLYRGHDGRETLMVVNHMRDGGQAVEIFDVTDAAGSVSLIYRAHVTGDALIGPNDVVAVSPDAFYVTNDHGSRTSFGTMLETWLLLPRANVVYYDGDVFSVAATGLRFANGVNVSPHGDFLYVAESTGRKLDTYARLPFGGKLTLKNEMDIPSALDNIDVAPDGDLWIASHPKLLDLLGYAKDPSKKSPSEVTKASVENGIPRNAQTIYENTGDEIGAASVAVADGKHLYIGSIFDPKILDCEMEN